NLQQTPIAISVANAQALQDRHVQSLFNLADGSIPSLRVATFEARQSALTVGIRGIVPYDQNQTARDNGVSVYLDGIALGKTQGLNAALFDVERIEVLKGPQGTLFGRNTEGGAVSIITRAPSGTFGVKATASYGNYGAYRAEAHIDLPAWNDVSFKFDGLLSKRDGTVTNPTTSGQPDFNSYDKRGAHAQIRWRPSDDFTADYAADVAVDATTPYFVQLLSKG